LMVFWAIVAVFFIAFMILTHELGHYFAAKAVGIKVQQFSIGFGPEIAGFDRGETRYSLKWFLAGGSVKILGMNPDEEIPPEDLPRSYYKAPAWKRAIVIVAGSFVHTLIAFLLFFLLFWPIGYTVLTGKIEEVQKTVEVRAGQKTPGPGYIAGLRKGDLIKSVDGHAARDWSDMVNLISERPGKHVVLQYERLAEKRTAVATLLNVNGRGILGVRADTASTAVRKSNPIAAIGQASKTIGQVAVALVKGLCSLFSAKTAKMLVGVVPRSQDGPRSVVGATQLTFQAAGQGASVFIYIIAQLFLFLAIFNLAPLPPFDGGHLMVIVIEKLLKKKIDVRKIVPVAWAVIVVLSLIALRLALLDIFNPLRNPFK